MGLILRIKKRSKREWATAFCIFMPFSFGLLIDFLGLPSIVKYSIDIAWIYLLFILLVNRIRMPNNEARKLLLHTFIFVGITLVGAVLALQNPLYYLWGFRNNFRCFVLFFSCILFVRESNIEGYFKAFDFLFYVNFPIVLFQYFILGYKQDFLGGIFGVHVGCNDTTVVFFSIIILRSVLLFMNGEESILTCGIKCVISLLVSVFAEIKIFFVIVLVIVTMCALITRFSVKKLVIFFLALFGVLLGAKLLERIFSNWENWFTLEYMFNSAMSANGYTGRGDMNRLTGLPIAWNLFLTTWQTRLFGLGLGNCDTSSFSFLRTAFFDRYNYLHYNWFSSTFMFLETGIFGLVSYFVFFIKVYLGAKRMEKQARMNYCCFAQVMAVISLIMIIYNQSLRTEASFMMYFIMALPFMKNQIVNVSYLE